MPLTRALSVLAAALMASFASAFGLQAVAQEPESHPVAVYADWSDRPASVDELTGDASAVVEATVVSVEGGPDLVDASAPADPETTIPTQRISFAVDQLLEGHSPGESFRLFKTGSEAVYLRNDPSYEVGESYVLFIRPREGEPGTFLPAAPDGRLRLGADDEADALIPGEVAEELEGLTPEQVEQQVAE